MIPWDGSERMPFHESVWSHTIIPRTVKLGDREYAVPKSAYESIAKWLRTVSSRCAVSIAWRVGPWRHVEFTVDSAAEVEDMLPKKGHRRGERLCYAEYRSDQGRGSRSVWHGNKRYDLVVAVCGAWVYPENTVKEPEHVTCGECSDTLAAEAAAMLRETDW